MKHLCPRVSAATLRALTLALALAAASAAQAGSVQVKVTGMDGQPAANVAVWVPGKVVGPAPGAPVVIEQKDLQFAPFLSVVRTGTTVRFSNVDPYDHHVRSVPSGPLGGIAPAKNFEFRLAGEGTRNRSAEVTVDKAGIIGLGCHLHASMRGHLLVLDATHFAKTDAQGVAVLDNLPDGAAEVKMWHPDQLSDQRGETVTVGAAPKPLALQLNFSPRKRRGA